MAGFCIVRFILNAGTIILAHITYGMAYLAISSYRAFPIVPIHMAGAHRCQHVMFSYNRRHIADFPITIASVTYTSHALSGA